MASATVSPATQAKLVTRLARKDFTASTARESVCVRMAARARGRPASAVAHLATLDDCKTSRKAIVTSSLSAAFKAVPTARMVSTANTRAIA